MNEQYFDHKYIGYYTPSIWCKIKMFFVGKKIVEIQGPLYTEWYAYKGTLYLTEYRTIYQ